MNTQNRIREAIDAVIGWDIPDQAIGHAVIAQAEGRTARNSE